jgi:hypothetical protein
MRVGVGGCDGGVGAIRNEVCLEVSRRSRLTGCGRHQRKTQEYYA